MLVFFIENIYGGEVMAHTIVLEHDARIFQAKGRRLHRTGEYFERGSKITVGDECTAYYNHGDVKVVPILEHPIRDCYLLLQEIERGMPDYAYLDGRGIKYPSTLH